MDMAETTEAMPIMARRPFLSSLTRFSASCSAESFFVKPGVSQKFCSGQATQRNGGQWESG